MAEILAVLPLVGGQGGLAHPEFGSSVNPITTRGTDYTHLIITGTPGFSDLPTALDCVVESIKTSQNSSQMVFRATGDCRCSYRKHQNKSVDRGFLLRSKVDV